MRLRRTLTIRTDARLREALAKRAGAEGKSISELVRELLEEALLERPIEARTGHLKGRLALSNNVDPSWRKPLRERNWRS